LKTEIDIQAVRKIYGSWAPVYDLVFGAVFERGRRATVAAAERIGGRVLEAGVGTGIALAYYSDRCRVTGIDLSEEMLQKARLRADGKLPWVEKLAIGDVENLDFPDNSFDSVVAVCVVNTVPHPAMALEEFARVLKPGGEIILLNRVGADAGAQYLFEHLFQPVANKLGWRSDFPWDRFAKWLESSRHPMTLVERRPMPPFGHFSLLRFGKALHHTHSPLAAMAAGPGAAH
jgi:phosphatidylethanolamine/phosphatidyl-N-methylethanolamine N-methyltransferase